MVYSKSLAKFTTTGVCKETTMLALPRYANLSCDP